MKVWIPASAGMTQCLNRQEATLSTLCFPAGTQKVDQACFDKPVQCPALKSSKNIKAQEYD